jgi:hypothetical protein
MFALPSDHRHRRSSAASPIPQLPGELGGAPRQIPAAAASYPFTLRRQNQPQMG